MVVRNSKEGRATRILTTLRQWERWAPLSMADGGETLPLGGGISNWVVVSKAVGGALTTITSQVGLVWAPSMSAGVLQLHEASNLQLLCVLPAAKVSSMHSSLLTLLTWCFDRLVLIMALLSGLHLEA
jgi:hypothetical protein